MILVDMTLEVYDQWGRLVARVFEGELEAGNYRRIWDGLVDRGQGAASGTYIFRLTGAGVEQTQKAVLVR